MYRDDKIGKKNGLRFCESAVLPINRKLAAVNLNLTSDFRLEFEMWGFYGYDSVSCILIRRTANINVKTQATHVLTAKSHIQNGRYQKLDFKLCCTLTFTGNVQLTQVRSMCS